MRCRRRWLRGPREPAATKLLGEPSAQPLFNIFLGQRPLLPRIIQPTLHFVQDVEMVLDVLQRTIPRKLVQERFDLLFSPAHFVVPPSEYHRDLSNSTTLVLLTHHGVNLHNR